MNQLKNAMEEIVLNHLKWVLADTGICTCEKCMLDVMAIALNDLPPKYFVTKKGEMYNHLNLVSKQFEVDVIAAILKAAKIVMKNPMHNQKQ